MYACVDIWEVPDPHIRELLEKVLIIVFNAYLGRSQSLAIYYYIGGSLYVGLRLIFQDGDQIFNFQMIINLLSYVVQLNKWL